MYRLIVCVSAGKSSQMQEFIRRGGGWGDDNYCKLSLTTAEI